MRSLLAVYALALGASSFAGSIFIENHSFEEPVLPFGSFFYSPTPIPGWSSSATGGNDRGVWHTDAPGKDGTNIAFAYKDNFFAQQTSAQLEANTVYTVDYIFGRTGGLSSGTVELWAGGVLVNGVVAGGNLLGSKTVSVSSGQMDRYSFDVVTAGAGPSIGELISIRLVGTTQPFQSFVSFDEIRLTSAPVPEPATLLGLGAGAAALLIRRRKRASGV